MTSLDENSDEATSVAGSRWRYGRRGYALAASFAQLGGRKLASATTLLALGITLALPALLLFTMDSLDTLASRSLEGESLTLYLDAELPADDSARLRSEVAARPGVRETRYISPTEALETFREQTDVDAALIALGKNPLPGAIVVYPDTDQLEDAAIRTLATALGALPGVERVQADLRWVRRLQAAVALAQLVAILLAGFLLLTALLVIANTIRLELSRRRNELEVSRLLGASGGFLARPVIYAGAVYGFLGGLIGNALALLALQLLRGPADDLAQLYGSGFLLSSPSLERLGLILLVSTLLGLLAALLTLYGPSRQKVGSGP